MCRIGGHVAAGLGMAALISLVPSAALASHGNVIEPDNRDHYMDRNSLTADGNLAATYGQGRLDSQTNMRATFDGSGDVEIYDGYYGDTGWYGRTYCADTGSPGECDVFTVQFNNSYMGGLSDSKIRSLGCHELGHTASLNERSSSSDSDNNSCMRVNIWPSSYDSHDVNEINAAVAS